MGIRLGLNYSEQLPDIVRDELEQLVASIQGAFNQIQSSQGVDGDYTIGKSLSLPGQHRARLIDSSNQALVTATFTPLTFAPTEFSPNASYDIGGLYVAALPTRLTIRQAGTYLILVEAKFDANAAGFRYVRIFKNTTVLLGDHIVLNIGAGSVTQVQVIAIANLSQGDYVEVVAYQDSGGNLNVARRTIHVARMY